MSQPDVRIDPDALRSHARMVDEAASMCDEAVAAGRYLDLHDEVYGEWCGKLFVPMINPAQDWALRELRGGVDATSHLAELLRAVADGTDATDGAAAQRIREAGR
jgi:hypothetical protein